MELGFRELCARAGLTAIGPEVPISAVTHDSRQAGPGVVFVARRGATDGSADGHGYLEDAVARGASAVVIERLTAPLNIPHAIASDSRVALARMAETVAGEPSTEVVLLGVTGTNGKTTVAHMAAAALEACGIPCAIFGTLGVTTPKRAFHWSFTTPEAPELSCALRQAVDDGARAVVMEVSSHALALRRADGLRFDIAAFTNLSQDHLDFHHDIERYFQEKMRLFTDLLPGANQANAVACVDHPHGERLAAALGQRVLRVGSRRATADLLIMDPVYSAIGSKARVVFGADEVQLTTRHVGDFNLENAAVALGMALTIGLDLTQAATGIASCPPLPGRMERVSAERDPSVYVDFAHTPEALHRALSSLRVLCAEKLRLVFGCGGDRDRDKRATMGRVAAELADDVIITDDNPRSESGVAISDAVLRGARSVARPRAQQIAVERDRAAAIGLAIGRAAPGDLVLIAGKGHEQYQISGDQRVRFSDREEAQRALSRRVG